MKKILETLKQKWAEYLLEILVITIGILGAFMLNAWNTNRTEIENLKNNLQYVIEDLGSDKYQLIKLIQEREASLSATTKIIDTYKKQSPINTSDFLNAFNYIVVEQKFENNTSGFDNVQNSILFESYKFQNIRNLIRDYKKSIDGVKFVESKQNTSSEIMESELLRNGFYDNAWADFRAYYQPKIFQSKNETTDFLKEINKYSQVKAIFMRNEWVLPFIIEDYKSIIAIGENLKIEIERYLK